MGHEEHKHKAPETVRCGVITVSDTRDRKTDESGKIIREMLMDENHEVVGYKVVKDEPDEINDVLEDLDAEVYVLNGGTGISERDVTPDVLKDKVEKELSGFGEAFRRLSYEEIGSASILSRAFAGVREGKIYFAIPGSTSAVELALQELILPELGHMVYEVNK